MKKFLMGLLLTAMAGALASSNALADAEIAIQFRDGASAPELNWWSSNIKMNNTDSQPSGPTDCLQNGRSGDTAQLDIFLSPPFKGSASKYKYGTFCHRQNDDWATVYYGISLSGCALWVCSAKFSHSVSRKPTILDYGISASSAGKWIHFWFNDASGNVCIDLTCP